MKLQVYNGEIFKRGWLWYRIMWILFIVLFMVTLFSSKILGDNTTWLPEWTDLVSAFVLLLLFAWYWFYTRKEIEKKIVVRIDDDQGLWIGDMLYRWHAVQGFSLEIIEQTGDIYNIIFFVNQNKEIYTVLESERELAEKFVEALVEYTTFLEDFHQWRFQKILRKLKI